METSESEDKVLYRELSYEVVGVLFDVYNEVGYGHREKHYENAVAIGLEKRRLRYQRQLYSEVLYEGKTIGKYFFDFLIESAIVLELKQGNTFSKQHIEQVYSYLKASNLKLGIIAQFTNKAVKCRRVLNLY